MNRIFKFRVYDEDTEKLYKPEDIFRIHFDDGVVYAVVTWENETIHKPKLIQFTGLTDKNGVEVYEYDIIESDCHNPSNMVVKFIEGGFCMCEIDNTNKESFYPIDINHFYPSIGCTFKVIGNVYDYKA